tara:strand:+ start:1765 stop:2025 length:261 start_codon:yes stop_codon:yes gene_type:complete
MKAISDETSKRVCNHMNKDHLDSVHKYLKYYGKISEFKIAEMYEITNKNIKIKYDDKFSVIQFEKEISEDEIHDTLVLMLKDIHKT